MSSRCRSAACTPARCCSRHPPSSTGRAAQRGIQLEVHPFAARALFGVPASELTGEVLELGDLVRGSREVRERLAEPVDAAAAVELVGGWLDRRLRDRPPPAMPAELGRAWQLIVGSGGQCRIGEVAREVGWSRRHLTTRLRAETGLGAKDLARVSRFQRSRTDDRCERARPCRRRGGLRVRRPIAPVRRMAGIRRLHPGPNGSPRNARPADPRDHISPRHGRPDVGMLFP